MKIQLHEMLALILFTGLTACASRPSMEELREEALRTGDWSAVEEREQMDRKMGRYDPDDECPEGEALYCKTKGERDECDCVSSHLLR